MKKSVAVITAVFVLTLSGLALAQMGDKGKEMMENKDGMMDGKSGMMGKGMMGRGMMMGMMKQGMMMKMMERDVIPAPDGSIIIVSATKLSKYDKDLNLVKEVDLKVDTDGMQKMMGMMKGVMDKGMMMGNGIGKDKDDDDDADTVDHASHHQ